MPSTWFEKIDDAPAETFTSYWFACDDVLYFSYSAIGSGTDDDRSEGDDFVGFLVKTDDVDVFLIRVIHLLGVVEKLLKSWFGSFGELSEGLEETTMIVLSLEKPEMIVSIFVIDPIKHIYCAWLLLVII